MVDEPVPITDHAYQFRVLTATMFGILAVFTAGGAVLAAALTRDPLWFLLAAAMVLLAAGIAVYLEATN